MTTISSIPAPSAASIRITRPAPPESSTVKRRFLAGGAAFAGFSLLLLAAYLTPSSAGLGTHEQLNLPPCSWPTLLGIPCITCGMTTSFAHAADGHLLQSITAQPMGFLLALATAMTVLLGSYIALTGSPIAGHLFRGYRGWNMKTTWIIIGLFLAAWAYKIVQYRGFGGWN